MLMNLWFSYNIGNILTSNENDEPLFIKLFGYFVSCVSKLPTAEEPIY